MIGKESVAKKNAPEKDLSFEESLERLEHVVRQLEDGQLGLSEALSQYEEGVRHLNRCHQALAQAERKIELLTAIDEDGNSRTEPFDDEGATGTKSSSKGARRSARSAGPTIDEKGGDVDTQRGLF